jgi:hypothetical protein
MLPSKYQNNSFLQYYYALYDMSHDLQLNLFFYYNKKRSNSLYFFLLSDSYNGRRYIYSYSGMIFNGISTSYISNIFIISD